MRYISGKLTLSMSIWATDWTPNRHCIHWVLAFMPIHMIICWPFSTTHTHQGQGQGRTLYLTQAIQWASLFNNRIRHSGVPRRYMPVSCSLSYEHRIALGNPSKSMSISCWNAQTIHSDSIQLLSLYSGAQWYDAIHKTEHNTHQRKQTWVQEYAGVSNWHCIDNMHHETSVICGNVTYTIIYAYNLYNSNWERDVLSIRWYA